VTIAHSVARAEEGVTVPLGGQSEAAASTGQNRAVEQAGPSSRQWETQSPSNLNSSDWRSLARCFESLPEPGDEASSLPPAQEALPQQPNPPCPAILNYIHQQLDAFTSSFQKRSMISDFLIDLEDRLHLDKSDPERMSKILQGIKIISSLEREGRPKSGKKAGDALVAFMREWDGNRNQT